MASHSLPLMASTKRPRVKIRLNKVSYYATEALTQVITQIG